MAGLAEYRISVAMEVGVIYLPFHVQMEDVCKPPYVYVFLNLPPASYTLVEAQGKALQ